MPDCSHFSEHWPVAERIPEQCWYTHFVLGGTFFCIIACNVLWTGSHNSGSTAMRLCPIILSYVTGKTRVTSLARDHISSSCLSENILYFKSSSINKKKNMFCFYLNSLSIFRILSYITVGAPGCVRCNSCVLGIYRSHFFLFCAMRNDVSLGNLKTWFGAKNSQSAIFRSQNVFHAQYARIERGKSSSVIICMFSSQ